MTELDDLLAWMRADLKLVLTGVHWAWGMGYSKAGRGLDAPRGVSLAQSEDDQDRGAVFDLGLGDHPARAAVHNVTERLVRAELRLNGAWLACGRTRTFLSTLTMVTPGESRTLGDVEQSLSVLSRLCDLVEADYEHVSDAFTRRRVFRSTGKAYDQLRFAVGGLERALNRGEEAQPSVPECVNGGCKNMASMRQHDDGKITQREAGLCDRCARFRRRNGCLPSGHRLSPELDREPWKYQNKRMSLGLGFGDESLSHAWRGPR